MKSWWFKWGYCVDYVYIVLSQTAEGATALKCILINKDSILFCNPWLIRSTSNTHTIDNFDHEIEAFLHLSKTTVMKRIITKISSQPFEKQNTNKNKQISFKPMQQPIHHVNLPLSPPPSIDNIAFVYSFKETVKCTTGRTNISKNLK